MSVFILLSYQCKALRLNYVWLFKHPKAEILYYFCFFIHFILFIVINSKISVDKNITVERD